MQTVDYVLSLIVHYGYLIVFFGVMLESIGVPLPGETILLASGFLVQQGALNLGDAITFGILGAVIGDQIGYWVGRKVGVPSSLDGVATSSTPERLEGAQGFFACHGGKAVFLARFVAGLRVFGALVAGISRMHWRTFLFYNALGGATWATAAVLVGYLVGGKHRLGRAVGRASFHSACEPACPGDRPLPGLSLGQHPSRADQASDGGLGRGTPAGVLAVSSRPLAKATVLPEGAYGLTVGLILTSLFSWAFGSIVQDVLALDPLVRADNIVLSFVHSQSEPYLTLVARIVELLFSPEVLLPISITVGTMLIVLTYRRGFIGLVFTGSFSLPPS